MAGEELAHKRVHVFHAPLAVAGEKFSETRRRWRELSVVVQRLYNDWHAHWLRLHLEQGNEVKVRQYMTANQAWHEGDKATRGPKPKCPVKCLDKHISNALYHKLRELHPQLHTRVCVLAMNKIAQRMGTVKGSNSAYPRWMLILAGLGEYPASSRPLPIPFDKANVKLLAPEEPGKPWRMEMRIELAEKGKSIVETFALRVGGRKKRQIEQALWKMAAGEWKYAGSDLKHTDRDGWTAMICCQMPAAPKLDLDAERVAVLRPGRHRPVWLRVPGARLHLGRTAKDVAHVRRSLSVQRAVKAEAYRWASSARKGHGKGRAMAWRQKLTNRWKRLVKRYNEQTAAAAVRAAIRNGCGTLVYVQPTEARRLSCRLATAGKIEDVRESTLWDWYQLRSLLERECEQQGIECVIRKRRERSGAAKTLGTSRSGGSGGGSGSSGNGKAPKGYTAGTNGTAKRDQKTDRQAQGSKRRSQVKAAQGGSGGRRSKG